MKMLVRTQMQTFRHICVYDMYTQSCVCDLLYDCAAFVGCLPQHEEQQPCEGIIQ